MMQTKVLPKRTIQLIGRISGQLDPFYLAGGTGLALQLGHRISEDLDFFSSHEFEIQSLVDIISPEKIISVRPGTLHCVSEGVRVSFLHYDVPLIHPVKRWKNINVAAWEDIVAEKVKTVSQRGAKKDFWDLYAAIKLCAGITEVCALFMERFKKSGINRYHVLKSLVYFDDAEGDPEPVLLPALKDKDWKEVKLFFEQNIRAFEKVLLS